MSTVAAGTNSCQWEPFSSAACYLMLTKNLEGKAIHSLICYILRCRLRAGLHLLTGLSWICFRYVICVPGGHQHSQIDGSEMCVCVIEE